MHVGILIFNILSAACIPMGKITPYYPTLGLSDAIVIVHGFQL